VPPIANHTPYLQIEWDKSYYNLTRQQLQEKLRSGNPSIEVMGSTDNSISLTVFMLNPGEEKTVAKRILEELNAAKV